MSIEYQLDRALSKINALDSRISVLEVNINHIGGEYTLLKQNHEKLKEAFGTMLVWTASAVNSPLRRDEVEQLIKMLK